jgi:hypothetical protein
VNSPEGHDFFTSSRRRTQLANARLPPGDKLKHVPPRSHFPIPHGYQGEALASHSSRYAGGGENFVLVLPAPVGFDDRTRFHSDFTDPKGPLLTSDVYIPQGYQGEALASYS